jgi:hypothetical protein
MSKSTSARPKRRIALPALIAGGAASLILALSMSPTVAAFSASITNKASVGTGALVMEQKIGGQSVCKSSDSDTNAATCTTLDQWGGTTTLVPGQSVGVDLVFANTGTVGATAFTLKADKCTQEKLKDLRFNTADDLCDKLNVTITSGGKEIFKGTAASLFTGDTSGIDILDKLKTTATAAKPAVAAGSSIPVTISVTLDQSADNSYAGLKAKQALTWTFNS